MPTINNATVATGTGLSTAGNGGRKLVRLSNGWLVSANYKSGTGAGIKFYVSTDNGSTWSILCTHDSTPNSGFSLAAKGTTVYYVTPYGSDRVKFNRFDATAVVVGTNLDTTGILVDSSLQGMDQATTTLAINEAGTELHGAWSSRITTYGSSYNIRYAKGTIAADGSVTWGAVEQRTTRNVSTQDATDPSITIGANGRINIVHRMQLQMRNLHFNGSVWSDITIYDIGYQQSNPVGLFVPQSINGLTNGRLWVAWHGKDATDSAKFNIRTSYSDDGGVTWSTPVKQTTGNLYDQMNASLTADAQGKVLLTWDAQNATTTQTALKVFNGTWGATTTLTGDGYTNVSTLFDNTFKLGMTTPPLIRQSTSGVYFSGNYFTGASVSPASSALGDKTASSVLSYTVTPESGSTVTSIVEKVNGATVNTYSNPASLSRTFTIPLANWDALKYYNTHTISVTVTDSNGMANTQVYSFNKALANDASLLEGAKAAKDGKDRISTKRDGIAGQVGLPPGSTFDAISAQLASGNSVMKVYKGVVTASGGSAVVNNLGFKPLLILLRADTSNNYSYTTIYSDKTLFGHASDTSFNVTTSTTLNSSNPSVTSSGFNLITNANITFNYIAIGI